MSSSADGPTALQVAIAAGLLLVGVVGADVALNRTVHLDVETDDGWRTLATLPPERSSWAPPLHLVEVNRSEEVGFRLIVDNQRLDAFDASYEIRKDGTRIVQDEIRADRLGIGEERFSIPGDQLLGDPPGDGDGPPRPTLAASLEVLVDGESAHARLDLQEVQR